MRGFALLTIGHLFLLVLKVKSDHNLTDGTNISTLSLAFMELDRGDDDDVAKVSYALEDALKNYDKLLRPGSFGSKLTINLAIHVEAITHVDESNMDFRLTIYLRQLWTDERLAYNSSHFNVGHIPLIHLPAAFAEKIWIPDTFFPGEKEATRHDVSANNQGFGLYPNGTVFYSTRFTVLSNCPMDLTNFPMDYQVCSLKAQSYMYPLEEVQYRWASYVSPVAFSPSALDLLSQFKLKGYRWDMATDILFGNFQTMRWQFLFGRSIGYYLVAIYIPAAFLVCISALGFFIDMELVPERLGLGVSTVVAMTTLLLTLDSTAPKVSYIKAMDVYVGFCFFMVFAALMQSALVSFLLSKTTKGVKALEKRRYRHNRKEQQSGVSPANTLVRVGDPLCCIVSFKRLRSVQMSYGQLAEKLDRVGAIVFPGSFAVFNLIYWIHFLHADSIHTERSWQEVQV